MKFSCAFLAAAVAHTSVNAQTNGAAKTVSNINGFTSLSSDLKTKAESISMFNCPVTVPQMIQGFNGITKDATKAYQEMQSQSNGIGEEGIADHIILKRVGPTYTEQEQEQLCNAYTTFVGTHQALIATVINKHGIIHAIGSDHQVAAVVRGEEAALDRVGFALLDQVPACANEVTEKKESLHKALEACIETYLSGEP